MGTIRIGRNKQNDFVPELVTASKQERPVLSDEEKANLLQSIKLMPKDKWVSALRSAGLDAEADECERSLAEEHLRELELEARKKRLDEIMAMDEDEQLALLIAEGYEEEAKALSEKLAVANAESSPTEKEEVESFNTEKTDDGNGEENQPIEGAVDGEPSELSSDAGNDDVSIKVASRRGRKPRSSRN